MEDSVSWPPRSNERFIIWKHILNYIWVTEALNRPQKRPNMVSFLNHKVSILYESGLQAEPSFPCLLFIEILNITLEGITVSKAAGKFNLMSSFCKALAESLRKIQNKKVNMKHKFDFWNVFKLLNFGSLEGYLQNVRKNYFSKRSQICRILKASLKYIQISMFSVHCTSFWIQYNKPQFQKMNWSAMQ